MTKLQKTFLGISAFLPLILIIGFLITLMGPMQSMMAMAAQHPNTPSAALPFLPDIFSSVFTLMIAMIIVHIALLILFIIHASKNRSVSDGERIIWIIVFFFAGTVAFPVYFFARIYGNGSAHPGPNVATLR